jgi:hypothetical protein
VVYYVYPVLPYMLQTTPDCAARGPVSSIQRLGFRDPRLMAVATLEQCLLHQEAGRGCAGCNVVKDGEESKDK